MNEMPTFDVSSIPAEFSPLTREGGFGGNEKQYADDGKLFVTFETKAILQPAASTKAGRPIYKDVDMITVRSPGSQLSAMVDYAQAYVRNRPILAEKYRHWKSGQAEASMGTPLENFPFLFTKPSMIAELKYRNIFTVEQLATIPDTAKQTIMGGHELCRMAADWIAKTKGEAEDQEKIEMRARLVAMEEQMAALLAAAKPDPTDTVKPAGEAPKPFLKAKKD